MSHDEGLSAVAHEAGGHEIGRTEARAHWVPVSARNPLVRFARFNLVGLIGIAVRLVAVYVLADLGGLHDMPATLVAIEISILHNFVWHERWTWADRRTTTGSGRPAPAAARSSALRSVFGRCLAFHAGAGLVAFAGGVILVPAFAAGLGLHLAAANLAAIVLTGLVGYIFGDRVVFA